MKSFFEDVKLFFRQSSLVAGKDFKYLVLSPLFFIFTGISFILLSYMFPRDLFMFAARYASMAFSHGQQQAGSIHLSVFAPHISYINLILLFSVPVLGMKLLAEEKRSGAFDLLMTSPLSSLQMLIGKYSALLAALGLFLIFTLIYPLSTGFFTNIPFEMLLSSYLGLFLLSGVYAAAALFASSLSRSLFLSAFVGMILNIGLWFLSQGQGDSSSAFLNSLGEYMSLSLNLTNFMKGSLTISSFVFFFSLIVLFLFMVFKSIEIIRWR